MLSRRLFLAGSAAGGLGLWSGGAARAEAVMTDDGFYREPWFLESFLELADDLAAASENKKRLAIMWELRGCPYCKETHLVNFAKPEITNYIKERFEILQLNIIGSREVTDFDGEKLTEKSIRAEIRRARRADLPVLPRQRRRACGKKRRASARSRAARAISSRSRFSTCSASSPTAPTRRARCCGCRESDKLSRP